MKWFQRLGLACWIFPTAALAAFFLPSTYQVPVTCLQGSSYADGCAGANQTAAVQTSSYFTSYAPQNGQIYSTRPPWNVAGADYPVGYTSNASITLANPAVVTEASHGHSAGDKIIFFSTGSLPSSITAGQTYYVLATGLTTNTYEISASSGGSAISTASQSQSGYAAVFKDPTFDTLPTGCVYSSTHPNVTCTSHDVTFDHWYFQDIYLWLKTCNSTGFTLTNNYFLDGNNVGAGTYQTASIWIGNGGAGTCSITSNNNLYDNNVQNMSAANQTGNVAGGGLVTYMYYQDNGSFSSQYDVFRNLLAHGVSFNQTPPVTIQYDYVSGWSYNSGAHGEFFIYGVNASGTTSLISITFNNSIEPSTFGGGATTSWYINEGCACTGHTITTTNVNNNVFITNGLVFTGQISGASGGTTGTLTVSGLPSSFVNTFGTTTSGLSPTFSCGQTSFSGAGLPATTSAPEVKTTGCNGTGVGGNGTYTATAGSGLINVGPETMYAPLFSPAAAADFGSYTFATLTFNNNYVDPTGGVAGTSCVKFNTSSPTSITGNVNLTDGSTVDTTHCNGMGPP